MQTAILSDPSSRGQKLLYLTTHHRDLQGLRTAPLWAALILLAIVAKTSLLSRAHLVWAADIFLAAQFIWHSLSKRWYERRYGVVKEPELPAPSGLISILRPEAKPVGPRSPRWGHISNVYSRLILLWVWMTLPNLFIARHPEPLPLMTVLAAFLVAQRCVYPTTDDWSISLRRALAVTTLVAMTVLYLEYRLAGMNLLTWLALLLSLPLLLDLYDHWLLNHLLGALSEQSHE